MVNVKGVKTNAFVDLSVRGCDIFYGQVCTGEGVPADYRRAGCRSFYISNKTIRILYPCFVKQLATEKIL